MDLRWPFSNTIPRQHLEVAWLVATLLEQMEAIWGRLSFVRLSKNLLVKHPPTASFLFRGVPKQTRQRKQQEVFPRSLDTGEIKPHPLILLLCNPKLIPPFLARPLAAWNPALPSSDIGREFREQQFDDEGQVFVPVPRNQLRHVYHRRDRNLYRWIDGDETSWGTLVKAFWLRHQS